MSSLVMNKFDAQVRIYIQYKLARNKIFVRHGAVGTGAVSVEVRHG